jgi:hypothetical protein
MKRYRPYIFVYVLFQSFLFAFEVLATIVGCISVPRNDICSFSNSIYSAVSLGFLCATIVWFLSLAKTPRPTLALLGVSCIYHATRLTHHYLLDNYVNFLFLFLLLAGFSLVLIINRREHIC